MTQSGIRRAVFAVRRKRNRLQRDYYGPSVGGAECVDDKLAWAAGALALLLVFSLVLPSFDILDIIISLWPYLALPLLGVALIAVR